MVRTLVSRTQRIGKDEKGSGIRCDSRRMISESWQLQEAGSGVGGDHLHVEKTGRAWILSSGWRAAHVCHLFILPNKNPLKKNKTNESFCKRTLTFQARKENYQHVIKLRYFTFQMAFPRWLLIPGKSTKLPVEFPIGFLVPRM